MALSTTQATMPMPFPSSTNAWLTLGLGIALTGSLCGHAGAAQPIAATSSCPTRISTAQTTPGIQGWTAERTAAPNRLTSYGFYDGPVAQEAELAPSSTHKQGRVTTEQWRFDPPHGRIYLACRYAGTDFVLSQPLPAGVHACTAKSDSMKPQAADDVIACS